MPTSISTGTANHLPPVLILITSWPQDFGLGHHHLANNGQLVSSIRSVSPGSSILRYANHKNEQMSNALVQALKRELTPSLCGDSGIHPCVYQDPIVHRQLEPYRLHYR